MYRPGGREGDVHGELPGPAGRLRVDVGEGAEVVAGGDQVHPGLVAAGEVLDRSAGRGVERRSTDQPGRLAGPGVGGQRRGGRRRPASAASVGGTSAVIITLIAGRIGMPVPCAQASWPFMPRSAKSIRRDGGQAGAQREGDDGDAGQVGVLADPGAQRRVQDLRRRVAGRRKRRSRSALVSTLTELIAIAALASTGSSSRPFHQVQGAGGDRDEQQVVAERPAQALLHRGDGPPGQGDRGDDAAQVAADEGDVGGGDRDVGAGADGDADVGRGRARRRR